MLPNDEGARIYVADVIRQVKPTCIITHWKNSTHKDHKNTHDIAVDAVLLAGLAAVKSAHPPYGGVRTVYYAENWEDPHDFQPYVYIDVTDGVEDWKKALKEYQLMRGGISPFPYFDYYTSLVRMRGALAGFNYAEAFDVDALAKKLTLSSLP